MTEDKLPLGLSVLFGGANWDVEIVETRVVDPGCDLRKGCEHPDPNCRIELSGKGYERFTDNSNSPASLVSCRFSNNQHLSKGKISDVVKLEGLQRPFPPRFDVIDSATGVGWILHCC